MSNCTYLSLYFVQQQNCFYFATSFTKRHTMNSKNLLSTLLYALIGLLLLVVGYKACQIRKDKEAANLENDRFNQQLRDMGYVAQDTSSSAYVSDQTKPTYADGAVENTTTTAPATHGSGIETDNPKPEVKTTTDVTDEEGQKVRVSDLDAEYGMVDKPKYMVITGSFRQLANARKSMEALVKKGYNDAEVGRFNKGTYACAIAKRTNSLNDANSLVKKLKGQGFNDAFVKTKK